MVSLPPSSPLRRRRRACGGFSWPPCTQGEHKICAVVSSKKLSWENIGGTSNAVIIMGALVADTVAMFSTEQNPSGQVLKNMSFEGI